MQGIVHDWPIVLCEKVGSTENSLSDAKYMYDSMRTLERPQVGKQKQNLDIVGSLEKEGCLVNLIIKYSRLT